MKSITLKYLRNEYDSFGREVFKRLKDLGFKVEDNWGAEFGRMISKGNAKAEFEYLLFYPKNIGTGRFKKVKNYCDECGSFVGTEDIEIMRRPTNKEKKEQIEQSVEFIANRFKKVV